MGEDTTHIEDEIATTFDSYKKENICNSEDDNIDLATISVAEKLNLEENLSIGIMPDELSLDMGAYDDLLGSLIDIPVAGVANSSYAQVDEGSTNPGYFTWAGDVTITFVGGSGAYGTMPQQIVKRNVTTTLNANKFRKTGYTFLYWKDVAGNIYTKTIKAYESMTLTAQWQEIYYPSRRDSGNGGGGGGGSAGIISNLIQVNRISIDGVLTIKDSLNGLDCSWNYDPINNKWRLNTTKDINQASYANNGFYAINTLSSQIIDGNTIVIVSTNVYYFDASGFMYTGLLDTKGDGKEYLFEIEKKMNEGQLFKGWKKINGYWYYFGPDGAMYKNQFTPEGYYVDAEGKYRE